MSFSMSIDVEIAGHLGAIFFSKVLPMLASLLLSFSLSAIGTHLDDASGKRKSDRRQISLLLNYYLGKINLDIICGE